MKLADIKNSVSTLPGTGTATAKLFARLNIFSVADLLQFYPKEYQDRTKCVPLCEFAHGNVHTAAKVVAHEWFGYGKMRTLKIIINDGKTVAALVAFGRAFLEKNFPVGSIISVSGNFTLQYGEVQCAKFEATKLADGGNLADFSDTLPDSGVIPIYHLTEGLKQKNVRKAINAAIKQYGNFIDDELPEDLISERKLLPKHLAIKKIHEPENMADANLARTTLIYEELFHFQSALAKRAWQHTGKIPDAELSLKTVAFANSPAVANATTTGNSPAVANATATATAGMAAVPAKSSNYSENFLHQLSPLQKKLLDSLSFNLTPDQTNVIFQINEDLDKGYREREKLLNETVSASSADSNSVDRITANENFSAETRPVYTMQRLLQGDVGSGKTIVALFACLRVISWRGQCAIMAPTELLAKQHAESTAKLLEPLGIRIAFLSGNIKSKGRSQLLKALKDGEIDIVVGTHALFSRTTEYNDLQLAVIDEQHRFGVLQRQAIIEKGRKIAQSPTSTAEQTSYTLHLLMMSATPIPQTLALTVFGDLDVSVLHSMPQGRKPIITYLVREGNERNAYEAVRKELQAGHQAYFVYPAIEEGGERELKSAEEMFAFLQEKVYPEYRCALVHGKIDEAEQEQIFQDFRENKIQVLAATTVIEVGIDVPNTTCIVIEQADFFGLAQLHQLRGRVGRNALQSFCFLIYSKGITETGIQRMKVLRESTDGFYIAEQDLLLRGPGEMTGTIQAGNISLGIADIVRDKEILMQARKDAFNWLKKQITFQSCL